MEGVERRWNINLASDWCGNIADADADAGVGVGCDPDDIRGTSILYKLLVVSLVSCSLNILSLSLV